jgi:hypothetical protein
MAHCVEISTGSIPDMAPQDGENMHALSRVAGTSAPGIKFMPGRFPYCSPRARQPIDLEGVFERYSAGLKRDEEVLSNTVGSPSPPLAKDPFSGEYKDAELYRNLQLNQAASVFFFANEKLTDSKWRDYQPYSLLVVMAYTITRSNTSFKGQ